MTVALGAMVWPLASCHSEGQAFAAEEAAHKVAAIQYGTGNVAVVDAGCYDDPAPDLCAVQALVSRAASQGAQLIVTPEYGFVQYDPEADPRVGDNPGRDAAWAAGSPLVRFSDQARKLSVYLAVNLLTTDGGPDRPGASATPRVFNALVLFDPTGTVVANHHKFELFAAEEASMTPGAGVTVVSTPLGRLGLMVCADLYGDLRLHDEMINELGADLVVVSAHWTAGGAARWPASFARNWKVPVVSANTTNGPGVGGGIFDARGRPIAERRSVGLTVGRLR